jgi:uncharacterized GH25 family protein
MAGNAVAHDMFIMPDRFRIGPGENVRIGFHSADGFPESSSLPKRLTNATLHSGAGTLPISLVEDARRMVGNIATTAGGHLIVTVVNAATTETMRPASFLEYIKEEGLSHVVDSRIQRGEAEKPAREKYTMFAKSILLSGRPDDTFKRGIGLPIEFVPEKDPYSLKSGESLPVIVFLRGAPAAGLQVMAASTSAGDGKNKIVGTTDATGRVLVPVNSGKWRLHTLTMERSSDPDADWESLWATLTFEIP